VEVVERAQQRVGFRVGEVVGLAVVWLLEAISGSSGVIGRAGACCQAKFGVEELRLVALNVEDGVRDKDLAVRDAAHPATSYEAQASAAVANLRAALQAAGADAQDLVKTTVYVVAREREDLVRVWRVVEAELAPARPPSTLLGVSILGYAKQLVEIEGIASMSPEAR
jgi:enamine deaminase RidA (YjgF/YER057c/UK114 family)